MLRIIRNFLFAIIAISVQSLHAQDGFDEVRPHPEFIQLDHSFLECIYSQVTYDPVKEESRDDYRILEIGDSISKYSSYGSYQVDSVMYILYPDGISFSQYRRLSKGKKTSSDFMLKDAAENTLTVFDNVFIDKYVYDEPIPAINWSLSEETLEVCGYMCHKATTGFRGRQWTAWYSDIPVNNGPWKFGGLPGLILKIEDADKEHIFEAICIRNSSRDFGRDKLHYLKTTREKFNEALAEYKNNPGIFLTDHPAAPKPTDGNPFIPNRRMFFNPIEKE